MRARDREPAIVILQYHTVVRRCVHGKTIPLFLCIIALISIACSIWSTGVAARPSTSCYFGCNSLTSVSSVAAHTRDAKTVQCDSKRPVGLCAWEHKCKGAGPLHKCVCCSKPRMHIVCHAACGLPDGIGSVDELPEDLKGIAPTCSVFCQLCGLTKLQGTGARAKEVVKMERLWKQKMMRLNNEYKAYKVGDSTLKANNLIDLQCYPANAFSPQFSSMQHAQCTPVLLATDTSFPCHAGSRSRTRR